MNDDIETYEGMKLKASKAKQDIFNFFWQVDNLLKNNKVVTVDFEKPGDDLKWNVVDRFKYADLADRTLHLIMYICRQHPDMSHEEVCDMLDEEYDKWKKLGDMLKEFKDGSAKHDI